MADPDPDSGPGRWSTALRLHLPFLAGVCLCLFAGWFELTRALAGRQLAWVYAFEWPLFAVLGTGIWWRQLHDPTPRHVVEHASPEGDRLDTDLVAWQKYLAKLQAADPPGGPPSKTVNARRPEAYSRRRPTETEDSDS